jgi:type I restriction enzyme S subunit
MSVKVSLGEVCEVLGGATPSKRNESYFKGSIPWATIRDMRGDMIETTECLITEEALASCSSSLIPAGKVVIATRVGLGKVCRVGQPTAINQDIRGLVPRDPNTLDDKYLYYCMKAKSQTIVAAGAGATVQGVRLDFIKGLEIPLPSLDEQRRIVKVLDEGAALISDYLSLSNERQANQERLWSSVVATAYDDACSQGTLVALSEIATSITDGDHSAPPKSQTGIPFITISNIDKKRRTIDFSDTFTVPADYYSSLKPTRRPQTGDILYSVTGSFGISVLVDSDKSFCFQRHIALIRPALNVNSVWLNYVLQSPQVFRQADAGATGAAQRTVSLKALRSIRVPRISLERQEQVARRLNALRLETQSLTDITAKRQELATALWVSALRTRLTQGAA